MTNTSEIKERLEKLQENCEDNPLWANTYSEQIQDISHLLQCNAELQSQVAAAVGFLEQTERQHSSDCSFLQLNDPRYTAYENNRGLAEKFECDCGARAFNDEKWGALQNLSQAATSHNDQVRREERERIFWLASNILSDASLTTTLDPNTCAILINRLAKRMSDETQPQAITEGVGDSYAK